MMNDLPAAERSAFVAAMSGAVTGVNVITTKGEGGLVGRTVSAIASVSADPPMVLACVNRSSPVAAAIALNRVFCINLLSSHQRLVSDVFAGFSAEGEPFDFSCADWDEGATGAPILADAVATFDCVLSSVQEAGSHLVFFGHVVGVTQSDLTPLSYNRRTYCIPSPIAAV